jgi:hypothetical protein
MWFSSWLRSQKRLESPRKRPTYRPELEALESRWVPSTLTVTNNLVTGGAGTLRAEIAAAASGDTIVFAPSLAGQTITLAYRELAITKSLTIQGLGAGQLTISGGNTSRVFEVSGVGTNVTLSGLAITHGNARSNTVFYNGDGGGILNRDGSTLTISDCTLSNNLAQWEGGGIANLGATLNVITSTVSGNTVIKLQRCLREPRRGRRRVQRRQLQRPQQPAFDDRLHPVQQPGRIRGRRHLCLLHKDEDRRLYPVQ